jgi:NAD(P)H dehydrogenase (quinone)
MYQSLNQTSNEGIFQFCGIEVLDHIYFEKVPVAPKETLMKYLDSIEQSVKNLPALSVEAHLYNNQR